MFFFYLSILTFDFFVANFEHIFLILILIFFFRAIHNFCVNQNGGGLGYQHQQHSRAARLLGADIYNRLVSYLKEHMKDILTQSKAYNDENLVVFYINAWDRFTVGSRFLNNIFAYLNRHWVKREREEGHRYVYDINTLCLIRWKEDLFFKLSNRLITAVIKLIDKQRDGETIDSQKIRTVVQSCVALGLDENSAKRTNINVYKEHFEDPFLKDTDEYYNRESAEFLETKGVVEYLKKATTRLKEESDRVGMYLRPESEEALKKHCIQVLVADHAEEIQSQFLTLLKADRETDLNNMFTLLESAPNGLVPLQQDFQKYVCAQGLSAVEKLLAESEDATVNPQKYVDTLLQIHDKYINLVKISFNNHSDMRKALDDACRTYINNNTVTNAVKSKGAKSRPPKTPELLAKYSDSLLRKSNKHTEVTNLDGALNNVMTILQFVDEKDAFEKTYTQTLARRLVNGTSLSSDAETNMVTKLKDIRGSEYTNKLQRMFQDISVSEELRKQFKDYLENIDIKSVGEFTPMVLADGYWPLPKFSGDFRVPESLEVIKNEFQLYYTKKHSGRKLQWLWSFSKGELRASFSKKVKTPYTFQVSIIQMAILLPFNDALEYTFEQLKEITLVDNDVLKGSLMPMVKAKILLVSGGKSDSAEPMEADTPGENGNSKDEDAKKKKKASSSVNEAMVGAPGSRYKLNLDFVSKKVRINLNTVLKSEQKRDADEVQKGLLNDRRMFLDACIVRIMKTRQESSHLQLIQETMAQASKRFKPAVSDIKKSIESLIEREYLERIDGKNYRYLA